MKRQHNYIPTVLSVICFGAVFVAQADETFAKVKAEKSAALLASPRYLEVHPERLRGQPPHRESPEHRSERLAKLTQNTALANSPRFQEMHPELRLALPDVAELQVNNVRESGQLKTRNKALAASPRFREEHPELSRVRPEFEIGPLK